VEASAATLAPETSARRTVGVRAVSTRLQLVALVASSFLLRGLASGGHTTPRVFPDEYIYETLGRSIGLHGDFNIRGEPAHFPALLEPLAAAPIWALASVTTAYRLVQIENALFMSLAAVPAYLLARKLNLTHRYAILCASFAVAIPDLVRSAYVMAGSITYPLVLFALYAGLLALDQPGTRRDLIFVGLAGLAVAARLEYVSLFLGFGIAAVALERRRVLRLHPLLGTGLGLAALAIAVQPHRALGYYSGVLGLHVGLATVRWVMIDLFLLALASGVVLVPGALVALLQPAGRIEAAFALFVTATGSVIVIEAALFAANGSERFQQRYLVALIPLVPVAFGLWQRRGDRMRLGVVIVAAVLMAALAAVPLSGYAIGSSAMDSAFLFAVAELERLLGTSGGAALVAGIGSLAAAAGVVLALGKRQCLAVALAIAILAAASVGAWRYDLALNEVVRTSYSPTWIDQQHLGPVTAIETAGGGAGDLLTQLFWNPSAARELVFQNASPTDAFTTSRLTVAPDGALRTPSGPLRGPFLWQGYGVSAKFAGATLVAHEGTFSLWKPSSVPRVRLLVTGRYWDGWLAWSGRITVWPRAVGAVRGTLALTLSLPRRDQPVLIRIGGRRVKVEPGHRVHLSWRIDGPRPRTLSFTTDSGSLTADFLPRSVRASMPIFIPAGRSSSPRAGLKPNPSRADS
jgi:hypothetical protein